MRIHGYEIINGGEQITFKLESREESGKMDSRYAVWRDSNKDMFFGLTDARYTHAVGQKVKDDCSKILRHLDKVIGFKQVEMCYRYKSDRKMPQPVEFLLDTPICTIKHLPDNVITELKKARNLIREEC